MKSHAAKAFLLSAFGYPGVGHLYLGRRTFGLVTIIVASICFIIPLWELLKLTWTARAAIDDPNMSFEGVILLLRDKVQSLPASFYNSLYFFALCWVASSLEAYRVGRVKDKAELRE
ncbi:hypothetical protein NBRC116494_20880 [Aurantivibrio plasticivorans]